MTDRELEEYRALRATIRERGTARVWVFVVGLIGWAAICLGALALAVAPALSVGPLLVLAATFEAVYALHIGVERIGRYIQVFHEGLRPHSVPTPTPSWEHVAMQLPRPPQFARADPTFAAIFIVAAFLNLFAANIFSATRDEFIFVSVAHSLFFVRVTRARAFAARQRAIDLARFEQLKAAAAPPSSNTAR